MTSRRASGIIEIPRRVAISCRLPLLRNVRRLCDKKKGCGDRKLEIGDVIHFPIDQYHGTRCAYIVAPEGSNPTREERLLILSENLKPDAKDKPAATGPGKN